MKLCWAVRFVSVMACILVTPFFAATELSGEEGAQAARDCLSPCKLMLANARGKEIKLVERSGKQRSGILIGFSNDTLFVSVEGRQSGFPLSGIDRVEFESDRTGSAATVLLSAGVVIGIVWTVLFLTFISSGS